MPANAGDSTSPQAMKFNPTRRTVLFSAAAAIPLAALPLASGRPPGLEGLDLQSYTPVFFDNNEWQFLLAACDRLIPSEGKGPGALETNVPVFIDQQLHGELGDDIYLQGPYQPEAVATLGFQLPFSPQQVYRIGIRLAQQLSHRQYDRPFELLDVQVQDAFLTALQKNAVDFAAFGQEALKPSQFFGQLLDDAKNGYLADPMYGGNKDMKAWVAIGFPGARAGYTEWVDLHDKPYPLGPVSLSGRRG